MVVTRLNQKKESADEKNVGKNIQERVTVVLRVRLC